MRTSCRRLLSMPGPGWWPAMSPTFVGASWSVCGARQAMLDSCDDTSGVSLYGSSNAMAESSCQRNGNRARQLVIVTRDTTRRWWPDEGCYHRPCPTMIRGGWAVSSQASWRTVRPRHKPTGTRGHHGLRHRYLTCNMQKRNHGYAHHATSSLMLHL